eukprot:1293490-Prorocentrum_lima.AAC.1
MPRQISALPRGLRSRSPDLGGAGLLVGDACDAGDSNCGIPIGDPCAAGIDGLRSVPSYNRGTCD